MCPNGVQTKELKSVIAEYVFFFHSQPSEQRNLILNTKDLSFETITNHILFPQFHFDKIFNKRTVFKHNKYSHWFDYSLASNSDWKTLKTAIQSI